MSDEVKEDSMSGEKVTKKARAKKTNGLAKATKRESKPKKDKSAAFPDLTDLRLEPGGITADGNSRYISFKFTNGFTVRLQDATANRADALKVRDLMSAWLTRRIGGAA